MLFGCSVALSCSGAIVPEGVTTNDSRALVFTNAASQITGLFTGGGTNLTGVTADYAYLATNASSATVAGESSAATFTIRSTNVSAKATLAFTDYNGSTRTIYGDSSTLKGTIKYLSFDKFIANVPYGFVGDGYAITNIYGGNVATETIPMSALKPEFYDLLGAAGTNYIPHMTNESLNLVDGTGTNKVTLSGGTNGLSADAAAFSAAAYYYTCQSNGVVGANVNQPLSAWAFITKYNTNTINGGANTYANITNYSLCLTNQFSVNLSTGYATNVVAGFYRISISISGVSLNNGAAVEADVMVDDVENDDISFITQFDAATARLKCWGAEGIRYLPAGSGVSVKMKSTGASGVSVVRTQLTIGTP